MRGGGEGVTNGTGLLLCQTADSRTEESLPGPLRRGGGGFASLHSLDILRPLFGLFRPYSESLGSAGFWATQYHTTRIRLACACKSASSACWHFSCGHWAEGTRYWAKSRPQLCKSALQCSFFRRMTGITCNFRGIPVK